MSVTPAAMPPVKVNKCVSMFQIIMAASFQGIRKRPPKSERFVNMLLIKLHFVYIHKLGLADEIDYQSSKLITSLFKIP